MHQVQVTTAEVIKDADSRSNVFSLRPQETTPENFDVHKYVAEGNFPGSIRIPGTNISIQVGGFAQLDAIADSNTIGSRDSFIVSSIPTGPSAAGQTSFSARQTRLFAKTEMPTDWGTLVTYVEGDFFGPDGTDFRLRHAYGEIGDQYKLLGGQTWTTFMDASVYPAIFDYQGPNSMVLVRQPQLRFTDKFCDHWQWQIALEDPNPDISRQAAAPAGSASSVLPDLTSNVRWTPKWGHLQLAGILRQITFDPNVGSRSSELGWGMNFTGQVNVFEPLEKGKPDNIVYQLVYGHGIANYINDTSGLGQDAFVNNTGHLNALTEWGGFVAYQHWWHAKWCSSVGYSYLKLENDSGQTPGDYKDGHYLVVNVMYFPIERICLGLEGLYGIRQDKDGATGEDGRMSFSVQYRF